MKTITVRNADTPTERDTVKHSLVVLLLMVGAVVGQDGWKFKDCTLPDKIFKNSKGETIQRTCHEDPQHQCVSICETHKVEAVDVPAIQEKRHPDFVTCPYVVSNKESGDACIALQEQKLTKKVWTCKDTHRVLLESVDGSIHVCHKVNQ